MKEMLIFLIAISGAAPARATEPSFYCEFLAETLDDLYAADCRGASPEDVLKAIGGVKESDIELKSDLTKLIDAACNRKSSRKKTVKEVLGKCKGY